MKKFHQALFYILKYLFHGINIAYFQGMGDIFNDKAVVVLLFVQPAQQAIPA